MTDTADVTEEPFAGIPEAEAIPVAPKRRGRRTKAEMAAARAAAGLTPEDIPVEIKRPTLTDPEKASRGRKKGPDLSVLVETTVVGLFGLVAVATAHEHWLKERADVVAITGPLNAWIDQLPSKTLKRLEKNLAPCLLVVGVATVIGPDIVLEVRLRDQQNRTEAALSRPQSVRYPPSGGPVYSPAGSPVGSTNGTGGPSGPEGGWSDGIPARGPIDAFGGLG